MVQDHLVTFYAIYSAKYRQFHGIVALKVIVKRELVEFVTWKMFLEHLLLAIFVLSP